MIIGGKMFNGPNGASQSVRALCRQKTSANGIPQKSADKPRIKRPREKSSSPEGGVEAMVSPGKVSGMDPPNDGFQRGRTLTPAPCVLPLRSFGRRGEGRAFAAPEY